MIYTSLVKRLRIKVFILFLLVPILWPSSEIHASSSLSVNPSDGGTSVRFGRVDGASIDNKEVRVRISTNDEKQYQIFQRMIEPLVNERGLKLANDAFLTYTISGSNSSGTLYNQNQISLSYGEQLLYTSSPDGRSDSFSVVYCVDKSQIRSSGNFLGKILLTLRPIGGNALQEVFLDLSMDIREDKKIEVQGSSGQNSVRLSTRSPASEEGYVRISFNGNASELNIFQFMEEFPRSELNEEISRESFKFHLVPETGAGGLINDLEQVEHNRQHIFQSRDNVGSFFIYFTIDPNEILNQKAGSYHGRCRYSVEGESFHEEILVDLEIEVTPIFKMDVVFPPEGVRFSNLLPGSPAQYKEVKVNVKSNLGRPFVVTQDVTSALTNERGERISAEFFAMKIALDQGNSGKPEFTDFSSVPSGRIPIFFSNAQGTSTQFKILYRLSPYPDMTPGNFSSVMEFSLEEL